MAPIGNSLKVPQKPRRARPDRSEAVGFLLSLGPQTGNIPGIYTYMYIVGIY